jgi:2-keto-4-pentenoate hydratase/2-oxohepta-3-ene-1,7-dioic acid hydratase in catechol pathway
MSVPRGDQWTNSPRIASIDLNDLNFRCRINGELRQDGNTNDMLFGFERLIAELSSIWTLRPGDMIYTGTPGGVGPPQIGDTIEVQNDQIGTYSWKIIV